MKYGLAVMLFASMVSCSYDNIKPVTIVGKWSVTKDSLNFGGIAKNYLKSDTDYYNFLSDGLLIVKEGNVVDSATYLVAANNVTIAYKKGVSVKYIFDAIEAPATVSIVNRFSSKYSIINLSAHHVQLGSSFNWNIDPPIVAGNNSSSYVKVNIATFLKR
jgi:hypothetical protein